MASVTLQNVTKRFGSIVAADHINLTVEDTELMILVGPSGCGKSTVLRMIAGLEDVTEGEINIDGRVVNDISPKDRDIAMVFQNYALYPHMTVFENMAFGLKLRKIPKSEIQARVEYAASILEITDLLKRKPKALSGGQRQRVAVGRAIVRKPKVFLFDEPLSNLDAKLRVQMRAEISKLHHTLMATMIYVTHDQTEAMTMGDRIVVLKEGSIQQIDSPMTLYHHPRNRFVAGFIGSPPMNVMEGIILQDNGFWFKRGQFKAPIPLNAIDYLKKYLDKNVLFGIRSEDVQDGRSYQGSKHKIECICSAEVVEPLGNHIFVHTTMENSAIVAQFGSRPVRVGERIRLAFDMAKAHFFDCVSGQSVSEL